MSSIEISAVDPFDRKRVDVLDSQMEFIDAGQGAPIIFLHGNPTSSYLWRNVIPHAERLGRCLAPDLIGMGRSGRSPGGRYRFADHARYLDAWFEAAEVGGGLILVGHDWGGALLFDWARRHPERVAGIAYMETIVAPVEWRDWPERARSIFQAMRSPAGEDLVLQKNVFVERILPASVLRGLGEDEMAVYRAPYLEPGESRRPTLSWPREIPIDGEPPDVVKIVEAYGRWLEASPLPKLFIDAEPGSILVGRAREFCSTWANQTIVKVAGSHFIQEDSPHEIGRAVAAFVRRVRAKS